MQVHLQGRLNGGAANLVWHDNLRQPRFTVDAIWKCKCKFWSNSFGKQKRRVISSVARVHCRIYRFQNEVWICNVSVISPKTNSENVRRCGYVVLLGHMVCRAVLQIMHPPLLRCWVDYQHRSSSQRVHSTSPIWFLITLFVVRGWCICEQWQETMFK